MTFLVLALVGSVQGAALAAAPVAAHARVAYPGVRLLRLLRPGPPRLRPDPDSPLATCLLRPCGPPRSEPLRWGPRGYAYPRPEQMVADLTRHLTRDPLLTQAAIWLGTDRIRVDVRNNRWFLSLRLPTP
ncbi:hypothetical protein [Anaeromyxobacter paludicola]|uniref:Uncharacterized protein n=1 Tax=Anaeromyxobacter paludicola TaxID=2918171 RepID=A0ABN6N8P8_9BACT|nr:hypothetical protein [Anaeromyxobacter paludicola]BDG09611.1 hypothetical protein AMPC_27240 [Anaeromyxobacter paludicola]